MKDPIADLTFEEMEAPRSKLLTLRDLKLIRQWLPSELKSCSIRRLFQLGKNKVDIPSLCKELCGKGATLFICKDGSGKKFGGFMDKDWGSAPKGSPLKSQNAFLFSLDYQEKYGIMNDGSNAGFINVINGPCFGHDLFFCWDTLRVSLNRTCYDVDVFKMYDGLEFTLAEMEIFCFSSKGKSRDDSIDDSIDESKGICSIF